MSRIISLGIFFLFFGACQKVPQAELEQIELVLDSAIVENINNIYREEFKNIQDSLIVVTENIEIEKSKIAGRNYIIYRGELQSLIKQVNRLRNIEKELMEQEEITPKEAEPDTET